MGFSLRRTIKKATGSVSSATSSIGRQATRAGRNAKGLVIRSVTMPTEIAAAAAGRTIGAVAPVVGQAVGVVRENPELATLAGGVFGGPAGALLGSAFGGGSSGGGAAGSAYDPQPAPAAQWSGARIAVVILGGVLGVLILVRLFREK